MSKVRLVFAILAARAAMFLSRILGRGRGSSLPGVVALKIFPAVLGQFAAQARRGVIMVTGTNGKTTTNNMIARVVEGAGFKILTNHEGANLITGVTAAFIRASSPWGRVDCDYALLEVDEASFPKVTRWIKPDMVVVTNFFRDQLDRYGELDRTVSLVRDTLKQFSGTHLVLNADDPLVAQLGQCTGLSASFYGVDEHPQTTPTGSGAREAKFCPVCGAELKYDFYHYSQLGRFNCPDCGFVRPMADVEAIDPLEGGMAIKCKVRHSQGEGPLTVPVHGLYNLYNALAAFSVGMKLGLSAEKVARALQQYIPATGRMERFNHNGKTVLLNLVKNPTGFNEGLAALLSIGKGCDVLIAINDNDADGRDISWLWDVDFEVLGQNWQHFNTFVCSGQRAEEMGVRLKYAGVPLEMIKVENEFEVAVQRALESGGNLAFFLATYTALWPVEKILSRRARREYTHAERLPSVS